MLRLHLESDGVPRVETTRKLVLANGYAGAGGPNCPASCAPCHPRLDAYDRAHPSRDAGRQGRRRHRRRLERVRCRGRRARSRRRRGASLQPPTVRRLSRAATDAAPRPPAPPVDRGYPNVLELAYELPDVVRWRNFLLGERRVASVPLDSLQRAVAFETSTSISTRR